MRDGRLSAGVTVEGERVPGSEEILTPDALEFVAQLHRSFDPVRAALLERRVERQAEIDSGATSSMTMLLGEPSAAALP